VVNGSSKIHHAPHDPEDESAPACVLPASGAKHCSAPKPHNGYG